jgi:light-harvesting complex I chlorophyll a/b binding protein 1
MAATLGTLVQENYQFTGYISPSAQLSFSDIPNGLAALDIVPLAGWVQMIVVIGLHEIFVKQRENKAPGDFGTGYFGVALDDQSSVQLRALNVEVQNGRLYVCCTQAIFVFISSLPQYLIRLFHLIYSIVQRYVGHLGNVCQ